MWTNNVGWMIMLCFLLSIILMMILSCYSLPIELATDLGLCSLGCEYPNKNWWVCGRNSEVKNHLKPRLALKARKHQIKSIQITAIIHQIFVQSHFLVKSLCSIPFLLKSPWKWWNLPCFLRLNFGQSLIVVSSFTSILALTSLRVLNGQLPAGTPGWGMGGNGAGCDKKCDWTIFNQQIGSRIGLI